MTRAHCPKCGSYTSPMPEQRSLFLSRAGLPLPANDNAYAAVIQASQAREAAALRKGICRVVGAERAARRTFIHAALRGAIQHGA